MLVDVFLQTNFGSIHAHFDSIWRDFVSCLILYTRVILDIQLVQHALNLALLIVKLGLDVEAFKVLEFSNLLILRELVELLKDLSLLLLTLVFLFYV